MTVGTKPRFKLRGVSQLDRVPFAELVWMNESPAHGVGQLMITFQLPLKLATSTDLREIQAQLADLAGRCIDQEGWDCLVRAQSQLK